MSDQPVPPPGHKASEDQKTWVPDVPVTFLDLTNGTVQGLEDDEKKLHDLIEQCAKAQDHADQCRTGWINDDKATPEMMMAASQAHRGAEKAIHEHIANMVGKRARAIADERKTPPEKPECGWDGDPEHTECGACDLVAARSCRRIVGADEFRDARREAGSHETS